MTMNLITRVVVLLGGAAALYKGLYYFPDTVNITMGLLALLIAHAILELSWYILPKSYLPDLDKRAVVISGCDSGFGNKLARKLDSKGVTVYACCLFPEGDGAKQLKNDCSNRLRIVSLDITKDDDVKKSLKFVQDTIGDKKLWALVNNAGIFLCAEAEYVTLQTTRRMLEVNVVGHINMTQAFLPMLRRSRGRVVFTSSIAAHGTVPATGTYSMTKAAISAFADGLRREMAVWSVTVHTVDPVIYSTDMANPDILMKNILSQWEQASDQVKSDYGGQEYEKLFETIIMFGRIFYQPAHKVYQVVDDLEHAAIGLHPKVMYTPGMYGLLWTNFIINTPVILKDFIINTVSPLNSKVKNVKHH